MIKRERRKVSEQGISLQQVLVKDITDAHWQVFYRFYALTYLKRHSQPYLNLAFFQQLAVSIPEQLMLILAVKNDQPVAASLFFVGSDTLYGRYWGCEQDYDALHFEACYYKGIEYCINHGLQRFDSGAQGEHKIARGFEPVSSYSAHWIRDPRFAQAIADFVKRERAHISHYKASAAEFLPFKQAIDLPSDVNGSG
jgi:predicted N-acyltransferase